MILVDTNVVSEVMKVAPSATVVEWLNQQTSSSLYVSTITLGEIEYGLRLLPVGKRRLQLKDRFERFIALAFTRRVLVYDEAAARHKVGLGVADERRQFLDSRLELEGGIRREAGQRVGRRHRVPGV